MKKYLIALFLLFTQVMLPQAPPYFFVPEQKYQNAMELFQREDYAGAFILFEELFNGDPVGDELRSSARYYSIQCMSKLGIFEGSISESERFNDVFSRSAFRPVVLYELGRRYFERENFNNSRIALLKLLADYPFSEYAPASNYLLGEGYLQQDSVNKAVEYLEVAAGSQKNNPFEVFSIYSLARAYEKKKMYRRAIEEYDKILSFHRESLLASAAQIRIGICFYHEGEYETSILELSSPLVGNLPEEKQAEALYLLANSYYRTGEYKYAAASYAEIMNKYPGQHIIPNVKYAYAWSNFQLGNYGESYSYFHDLSQGTDSLAEASYFWKAEAKRYEKKPDEALMHFQKFAERYPTSSLTADAKYKTGVIFFNRRNYASALPHLREAVRSGSPAIRTQSNIMMGEIASITEKHLDAAAFFLSALAEQDVERPLKLRAMLGRSIALYKNGDIDAAATQLNEMQSYDAGFEIDKVNYLLAEIAFRKNDYLKALSLYRAVDKGNQELYPSALYGIGYCQYNLKDYQNAAFSFSDLVKLYPRDENVPDAKLRMANAYFALKNFDAARQNYQQLLADNSPGVKRDYVLYYYALSQFKNEQSDDAIASLNTLLKNHPKSAFGENARYLIGWIYFQEDRYDEAITYYENAMSLNASPSMRPLFLYSIGDAYYNLGDYDAAISRYRDVVDNYAGSPYVLDALTGLQYCYSAQGKTKEAVQVIDTYIAAHPSGANNDKLFFRKAEIYFGESDYEKARRVYADFISKYSNSALVPDAYYWMGKSYQYLRKTEDAIKAFRQVISVYPKSNFTAASVVEVASIRITQNRNDEALRTLEEGLAIIPAGNSRAELLYLKGMLLLKKQDKGGAYDLFDEVIENYPASVFADRSRLEKGVLELESRKYDNASQLFTMLISKRNDEIAAGAQYYHGVVYFERKQYDEAITALVRVSTNYGGYNEWVARAYLKMGESYEKKNDPGKAKEMYRIVLNNNRGNDFGREAQAKLRKLGE